MTILKSLKDKLHQAYPAEFGAKNTWKRTTAFALFVALFLGYFRPFGLITMPVEDLYFTCTVFGAITFLTIFFNTVILPYLWKSIFEVDSWNIGKEILFTLHNFITIGIFNFVYFSSLIDLHPSIWWTVFFEIQLGTLAVGIVPVTLFVFYDQNRLLKKNLQKSQQLSQQIIREEAIPEESSQLIPLKAENGKIELELQANQLLYLKSSGNYLDIYYEEQEELKKFVLRNRLKQVFLELQTFNFYQCHRSYVVNLKKVSSVSGNARGFELHLELIDHTIPVARGKSVELETMLKQVQ